MQLLKVQQCLLIDTAACFIRVYLKNYCGLRGLYTEVQAGIIQGADFIVLMRCVHLAKH
jgi:hypothetical protein